MGTSATVRLIEGVRLIQYPLNTGFTVIQYALLKVYLEIVLIDYSTCLLRGLNKFSLQVTKASCKNNNIYVNTATVDPPQTQTKGKNEP